MGWGEPVKSDFDAKGYTTGVSDSRSANRATSKVDLTPGSYSVVGMKVSSVPAMQDAIENYVKAIKDHLDGINTDVAEDANKFVKSTEVRTALDNYITSVKQYCMVLASQLIAFNDKLSDVANAWIQSSKNVSDTLNTESTKLSNDAGQEYQRQYETPTF